MTDDYQEFWEAAHAILEGQQDTVSVGDLTARLEPPNGSVISSPKWVVEGPDGRMDVIYPSRIFAVTVLANHLTNLQAEVEARDEAYPEIPSYQ